MALQTVETFSTGVVAPEAYSVIMQAQINRAGDRIEAEVHVYYNDDARLNSYEPMKRFLYTVEDNAKAPRDTALQLNVIGAGDVTITNGEDVLATAAVTEEDTLQDIAETLAAQSDVLEITATDTHIIVQATGELSGSAGALIDVQGEAVAVVNWTVGEDGKASDLETYFSIEALSEEGVNLQSQLYEHIKANDPRYAEALDV